jgi:hypothetical protein
MSCFRVFFFFWYDEVLAKDDNELFLGISPFTYVNHFVGMLYKMLSSTWKVYNGVMCNTEIDRKYL